MRDRRFCCAYCQVRLYPFRREMDGLLLCRVLRLSSRNIASLPVVTDSIVLSLNGLTNSIVFYWSDFRFPGEQPLWCFWIPFFSDRKSLIGQKEESLHCTSGLDFAIGAKRFMTLLFERSES